MTEQTNLWAEDMIFFCDLEERPSMSMQCQEKGYITFDRETIHDHLLYQLKVVLWYLQHILHSFLCTFLPTSPNSIWASAFDLALARIAGPSH